jgi:regulatory protein
VRVHLRRAGVAPADVEQAITSLVEQGYLDDARFVRLFIQDKRELEDWGTDRITQALLTRGIEPELVDDSLHGQDADSELERALALLRRRFPSPPGDRRERERALGVLLRKGYDSELALDAIAAHTRDVEPLG